MSGSELVEWLDALREACERSSQAKVAKRLKVSTALVSRVLRGTYPGASPMLESRVRGELMSRTVACPVLGEILVSRCDEEMRRPFAATSPIRVQTYLACRECERSRRRT
jgi:hypothetical protein